MNTLLVGSWTTYLLHILLFSKGLEVHTWEIRSGWIFHLHTCTLWSGESGSHTTRDDALNVILESCCVGCCVLTHKMHILPSALSIYLFLFYYSGWKSKFNFLTSFKSKMACDMVLGNAMGQTGFGTVIVPLFLLLVCVFEPLKHDTIWYQEAIAKKIRWQTKKYKVSQCLITL